MRLTALFALLLTATPALADCVTKADLAVGVRDIYTVFGGSRTPGDWAGDAAPLHACPGYSMGMGVMLGLFGALLDAGTLRATSSPNTLVLSG